MCTSLAFNTNDFYFGRNMDLDYHFGEKIVITPKEFCLTYKHERAEKTKYAIIGMASVQDNYPLYAEGANEKGLCISALNFEGNAHYEKEKEGKINLAPYEIIPYILSKCATVNEAQKSLENLQITDTPFSEKTGVSPLHWHIADKERSIVLESTKNGVKIYNNPVGILTNNPPFDFHLKNLSLYNHLKLTPPQINDTSLGLSMYGMPGDFSSPSRFIKLSMLKKYVICDPDEVSSVNTIFRMMYSVSPIKGCVLTKESKPHYTTYTCVINATKGIYYYTADTSLEIKKISLNSDCLQALKVYEL